MANPYEIGHNTGSNGTSLVVPVTTATAAGDKIVVAIDGTNGSIGTVTDTKSNNYTVRESNAGGLTGILSAMYVADGSTAALTTSDTVTITFSGGTINYTAIAVGIPGLVTTAFDVGNVIDNGSSSVTRVSTPSALSQASEVVIAMSANQGTGGTPAWTAPFTAIDTQRSGSGPYLSVAYSIVSSVNAVTASMTITSGAKWAMMIAGFELASGLSVSTFSLPPATQGVAYPVTQLQASGGSGTYTWSVTSGSPPSGIGVPSSGLITGTPAAPGTFPFTVQVSDGTSTATANLTIVVSPVAVAGAPYLAGSASAASGGPTTLTIPVTASVTGGDVVTVAATSSVTGVTMTVGPDTAGNIYSLIVSDTASSASQLFVFECDGASALTAGVDSIPVTYTANTGPLEAIAVGDNNVTGPDKTVIAHGVSTASATPSSGTLGQVEENAIAFIADANAGGVPSWASPWSSHVLANTTAGTSTRLSAAYRQVTSASAITASGTITSAAWTAALVTHRVTPILITKTLSNGVEGEAYSQSLAATGGLAPYSWAVTGLPAGLTFSGNVISGIPSGPGVFSVTISITDSQGVTNSLAGSITIIEGPPVAAAAFAFPNNHLTRADSDFTVPGFAWAAVANATSLAITSQAGLTGPSSLSWISSADGATSVHSGFFSVTPSANYICSGFILALNARDCQMGIEWYTSGSALIGTDVGVNNPSDGLSWQPLVFAGQAPANAAKAKVIVSVLESNAGDMHHIDLMYAAPSDAQILVDWINSTFSNQNVGSAVTGVVTGDAGQDFMDVSPFVRWDQGVTLTRGRQDAVSEIQPSSTSFQLQNDTGIFTRDKRTALINIIGGAVTLHRRFQVNIADDQGAWSTRADGSISDVTYQGDNTGNTGIAVIQGADVLAHLDRQDSLQSWTEEGVLADGPLLHWCLTDAGNAGGAGVISESSGGGGPAMRFANSDNTKTAPPPAFQDSGGGVETLADAAAPGQPDGSEFWAAGTNQPSSPLRGLVSGAAGPYSTPDGTVSLTPNLITQTARNQFIGNIGYEMLAKVPVLDPTASSYSFECWFTVDPAVRTASAANYGPYIAMSLGSARTGQTLVAGIFLTGTTTFSFHIDSYNQPPSFLGRNWPGTAPPSAVSSISTSFPGDTVKLPHHLVITISQDPVAPSVSGWIDGIKIPASFSLPAGQVYDTFVLGGAYGGMGCWYGSLAHASIYDYVLSSAQITTHCQLGQYGMWEETTDDCIAALASFAAVPPFWNNLEGKHDGLTMTEYQSIRGTGPVAAMQSYEQAEGGLLFVDAAGALNFHTRDWRMGHGPPDLLLPPDTFSSDLNYGITDQFMVNEMSVGTQIYQSGTSQVNPDSRAKYGFYASSTADSPTQLPLITWSRASGQLGLSSFNYFSDPNLDDRAGWQVNSRAEPWFTPGSVTIDMLTLDSAATGLTRSMLYAIEIDDVIGPTGILPASFPDEDTSMEWFVEGINETISNNARTIQFYCSPAEPQRAWIPGDPVYGALGTTARIGIGTADTSAVEADGKDVAHDAGRPYWPPAFIAGMNNPAGNNQGFVGALDIRGITDNLSLLLQPPMMCVGAAAQTQTMPNGSNSTPQIFWDVIYADTTGGMGLAPGWPNWYVCLVPGFYDIDASLVWGQSGASAGTTAQGWIVVAMQAAQALAAGTGTPLTVSNYVCPVGEQVRVNATNNSMVNAPATRIYLGLGDMVTVGGEQTTGSSKNTGTGLGGSRFSLLWRGHARSDDRVMLSSLVTGGTVGAAHTTTTYHKVYSNTHTYSYLGHSAKDSNLRYNTDDRCWQGTYPNDWYVYGSQSSQVAFNYGAIAADLGVTGTVKILSTKLSCTNGGTYYKAGSNLMVGWSTQSPGGATFDTRTVTNRDVTEEPFTRGQAKTLTLPNSFATAFQTGARMLIVGDGQTQKLGNYGWWQGGRAAWTLTIDYTVTT